MIRVTLVLALLAAAATCTAGMASTSPSDDHNMILESQATGRDRYRLQQWSMQSSSSLSQPW
jgi:hypothetical protein